jgi:hypothetical protein
MARKRREQHRTQNITLAGRIGTGIVDRAVINPRFKEFSCLQKVDKEGQLPHGGYFSLRVPFNVDAARKCLYRQWLRSAYLSFTRWVNTLRLFLCVHALMYRAFERYSKDQLPDLGSWIKDGFHVGYRNV